MCWNPLWMVVFRRALRSLHHSQKICFVHRHLHYWAVRVKTSIVWSMFELPYPTSSLTPCYIHLCHVQTWRNNHLADLDSWFHPGCQAGASARWGLLSSVAEAARFDKEPESFGEGVELVAYPNPSESYISNPIVYYSYLLHVVTIPERIVSCGLWIFRGWLPSNNF